MVDIIKLNEISPLVKNVFADKYELVESSSNALGIMVRSFNMHEYTPNPSVLCVGRAGAGTNNIPVEEYAKKGVVVFNTPGANANAVKELVILALLLCARKVSQGITWANGLTDGDKTVAEQVEKGKKAFGGNEISGKVLGVYGLGAIGRKVADAAFALGMTIVGYDPYLPESAKSSFTNVKIVDSKEELFGLCDYITFHVPLTSETKNLVNAQSLALMKNGVKIVNCSRGELVNNEDIISACESGKVSAYATDFPNATIVNKKNIICIPHLGASSEEAEDNCAVMAASQMVDYIENGNIVNSVNFPRLTAEKGAARTVVLFAKEETQAKIIKVISTLPTQTTCGMKKDFGAMLIDSDEALSQAIIDQISSIDGVIKVRSL